MFNKKNKWRKINVILLPIHFAPAANIEHGSTICQSFDRKAFGHKFNFAIAIVV